VEEKKRATRPLVVPGVRERPKAENVDGIVSTAAFRLDTQGGHILWSDESLAPDWGSASSHVAEKIANDLLSSIEKNSKRKK
jgi:hypothetical protein